MIMITILDYFLLIFITNLFGLVFLISVFVYAEYLVYKSIIKDKNHVRLVSRMTRYSRGIRNVPIKKVYRRILKRKVRPA